MTQVLSLDVPNASATSVRQAFNAIAMALATCFRGPTQPTQMVAGMFWGDETRSMYCQRNSANSAWVDLWPFDGAPAPSSHTHDMSAYIAWAVTKVLSVGYTINADTDLGLASAAVGGTITLNPATKPYQKITIDGDLVIAFHATALAPVRLTVINDATGGHAVSLDAATIYTPEGTYDPAPNKEFTFYLERDKTGGKATCYIVEKVAQ